MSNFSYHLDEPTKERDKQAKKERSGKFILWYATIYHIISMYKQQHPKKKPKPRMTKRVYI